MIVDMHGERLREAIARIASGPKHAKSLTRSDARSAMCEILAGNDDPVQAAIFLIGLRMKRETDEELLGLLEALQDGSAPVAAVPELVDVADPYDGFARTVPASPWLPAVLAACGLPALAHGVARLGPKHGLTTRRVLAAAGVTVDLTPAEAARVLAAPAVGWAFLDQVSFAPQLAALASLRERMVKRTALNTVERVLAPVRARERTHLLIGYTHAAYVEIYARLARAAGFDSALIVRGTEGGVVPPLHKTAAVSRCSGGGPTDGWRLSPQAIGIEADLGAGGPTLPASSASAPSPEAVARAGLAALSGVRGPLRASLVWCASLCLWHCERAPGPVAAAALVRSVLDDGSALARFRALAVRGAPSQISAQPQEVAIHA